MKYKSIIEYIESEIIRGNLKTGKKLPSIRELAAQFNCSNSTVLKAYEELEYNHVIYSIPQSGYFVVDINKLESTNVLNTPIDLSSAAPHSTVLPYKDFEHCMVQAIDIHKENLFLYTPPNGLPSLVKELEKFFWEYQIFTSSSNIFIVNGSQQAISILAQLPFPNGKNNILVEQPSYAGAIQAFNVSKNTILGIKRTVDGINLEELENLFSNGNIKFFYTIPRFHNPTGSSYSLNEKKEIARLAKKYDVFIVEDDYLADMDKDTKSLPIFSYDTSSRVIYIKSFSKVLLPGLRIGAVIVPEILKDLFQDYKKWSDLNTSVISQGALEIFIKSGIFLSHKKKIIEHYSKKMNIVRNTLKSIENHSIKWFIPDSGFFLSGEITNNWSSDVLINKLKSENILLSNMRNFFLKQYYDNKLLRISIARVDDIHLAETMLKITSTANHNSVEVETFNVFDL